MDTTSGLAGPFYQGRPLDRPNEEITDQGVHFDVGTVLSRRNLLGMFGLGAGAAILSACAPASGSSAATPAASAAGLPSEEIPDETAGPFPGDGSNGPDVLEQSGIVRRDIRTNIGESTPVSGVPLEFTLRMTDMANGDAPLVGAAIYAWHCDAQGRYSMHSSGVEGDTFLRGVQVADSNGQVTFTSIIPGCYDGRWPHIHFEVYPDLQSTDDSTKAIATSQLAVPETILSGVYAQPEYEGSADNLARLTLASDNVFGDDGGALQIATATGSVNAGYSLALPARVDPTTVPATGPGRPGGTSSRPRNAEGISENRGA